MPQAIPVVIGVAASAAGSAGAAGVGVLGTTILGTSITVGSAVSAALTIAGGIAQFLLSSDASAQQSSSQSQATFAEGTSPRYFYFGRASVGGVLAFWETTAPGGAGSLWRIITLSCEEMEEVEAYKLNNQTVTLDAGTGQVITAGSQFATRVYIFVKLGTSDQTAISQLTAEIPQWSVDHRCRGVAIAAIKQTQVGNSIVANVYPKAANGEDLTVEGKFSKLYDPRTEVTEWSRNGALAIMWALRHAQFGGLSLDDLSVDTWASGADSCDEALIDGDSEPITQYTLSGKISAPLPGEQSGPIKSKISSMLTGIDGTLYEDAANDGKLALRIGVETEDPEPPLTELEVISYASEEGSGIIAGYDAVRIRYTEPQFGYQENITPPYGLKDGVVGFITGDAAGLSVQTIEILEIDSYDQALRIAKKQYLRAIARRATIETNLAGILYNIGDIVTLDLLMMTEPELYRVTQRNIDMESGKVQLNLEQVDSAYMEWDPNTESMPLDLPPLLNSQGVVIDPPSGVQAAATTGGNVRVGWRQAIYPNTTAEIQWSETGADVFDEEEIQNPASTGSREITTSAETTNIDIRMRFSEGTGAFTDWTQIDDIDRNTQTPAQAAPTLTGPTATNGFANYTITPQTGTNIWKVQLLVDGVVRGEQPTTNAAATSISVMLAFGSYAITARTVNLSGNVSVDSSTINVLVSKDG